MCEIQPRHKLKNILAYTQTFCIYLMMDAQKNENHLVLKKCRVIIVYGIERRLLGLVWWLVFTCWVAALGNKWLCLMIVSLMIIDIFSTW